MLGESSSTVSPATSLRPSSAEQEPPCATEHTRARVAIDVPAFVDALRAIRIGVSWGGPESLVVPALAPLQLAKANCFVRFGISPRLVRINIGLEDVEILWADLEQALRQARR